MNKRYLGKSLAYSPRAAPNSPITHISFTTDFSIDKQSTGIRGNEGNTSMRDRHEAGWNGTYRLAESNSSRSTGSYPGAGACDKWHPRRDNDTQLT